MWSLLLPSNQHPQTWRWWWSNFFRNTSRPITKTLLETHHRYAITWSLTCGANIFVMWVTKSICVKWHGDSEDYGRLGLASAVRSAPTRSRRSGLAFSHPAPYALSSLPFSCGHIWTYGYTKLHQTPRTKRPFRLDLWTRHWTNYQFTLGWSCHTSIYDLIGLACMLDSNPK
jgi:hypothetical protein